MQLFCIYFIPEITELFISVVYGENFNIFYILHDGTCKETLSLLFRPECLLFLFFPICSG